MVGGALVDQADASGQAFIIRIWIEETAQAAARATWRGHITHVPSGERRYLSGLEDVVTFLKSFLVRMGISIECEDATDESRPADQ